MISTTHQLTRAAHTRLIASLTHFGNDLNEAHKAALFALNEAMTSMASGTLQGRLAFGLPTGTGKTRAIVEWITAVCEAKLPYSVAVAASRIEALCAMKNDLIANGVPEDLIGLLHEGAPRQYSLPATSDNDARPFLLMSHQMIRASEANLSRYNTFNGKPRNLMLYDESLITSDVNHFATRPLYGSLAACIEFVKRMEEHAEINNFLTEVKAIIEAAEDTYDPFDVTMIEQPTIDPRLADKYQRFFGARDGGKLVAEFLKAANLPLRMLKSGNAAIVSYQVVVPSAIPNILVLDASYPIRKLCHYDTTIKSAETLPSLKNVPSFAMLKQFDRVELFRLKTYGGRYSMEKRFKDRSIAKEVAQVVKTIDPSEPILCFVFKKQAGSGIDYQHILRQELDKAGVDINATTPEGRPRIEIATWGMETSLNDFKHCAHVFLVGILHRSDTELQGQYLGQIDDIDGEISAALTSDLQLSERAHSAYQALSRGTCRTVSGGQALPMKGYVVEIDPQLEVSLSKVMPGAAWKTWEPYFMKESDSLIDTWMGRVRKFLAVYPGDRISSQALKKTVCVLRRSIPIRGRPSFVELSVMLLTKKHWENTELLDGGLKVEVWSVKQPKATDCETLVEGTPPTFPVTFHH